jgi:hypothetical protein
VSRRERKPRKHTGKTVLYAAGSPAPPMPSDAEWEHHNQENAKAARPNVILRLPCKTRGCRERVGALEFTAQPILLQVAIRALWKYEPTDDARVYQRIRLLGAPDPKASGMFIVVEHWPRGSVLQLGCRLGHDWSEFAPNDLARRASAVL